MNTEIPNFLANQIFNTDLTSIDFIKRFNKTPIVREESVSQHTFWVILFTRIISSRILKKTDFQFVMMCVDAATVHDFEETTTGDVLFDFKHNSLNGTKVVELIDEYSKEQIDKNFPKGSVFNDYLQQALAQNEVKIIKAIVKVADWLACLKYEKQELDFGNSAFQPILFKSLSKYEKAVNKLKLEARNYFKNEVDEGFFQELNYITYEQFNK